MEPNIWLQAWMFSAISGEYLYICNRCAAGVEREEKSLSSFSMKNQKIAVE